MSNKLNGSSTVVRETASTTILPELVASWNETATEFPRDKTIAQLFEETVSAHPDSIALVFGSQRLSFSELNKRANRLAHRLRQIGVSPETMVGCCFDRSVELIVSLLAVLKAGGAYVPLDPGYPKERLDFLLEDTKPAVMLTQASLAASVLAKCRVPSLFVDRPEPPSSAAADANPAPLAGPSSLAYVMYTSGSTGRPKGVMIENRAIIRLVRNTNFCQFGTDEVFLQCAPISFDASTLEIWGPLLNGGRLVVMPPETFSLEDLGRVIREQGVTTLWLTAGLFSLMVEERLEDLRNVRQLLAGGDVISARHVRRVLDEFPDCCLINGYGPTENTTFTCCFPMRHGDHVPDAVPIGRPISNTQVYILDEYMCPVAFGEVGELYTAGVGLARGYLNNAEATREKFVANPFVQEAGTRMYRTGDMARWRQDGVVEFLGRIDSQVKILGHRIEPGEVEAALGTHEGLKQVCVVAQPDPNGTKRLVAYYVQSDCAAMPVGSLREFLATKLPHYMIPTRFVPLASFPLSPNGKVDRSALPPPSAASETVNEAPVQVQATEIEQTIVDLWRQMLRLERIGLDDNFFDLGGDSLVLVAIHAALQKALQVDIPVMDLFEFTTVSALARHLRGDKAAQPAFSEMKKQGQKQRAAFARKRERLTEGSGA
jgi:amino acid adenylation domain-containing protein